MATLDELKADLAYGEAEEERLIPHKFKVGARVKLPTDRVDQVWIYGTIVALYPYSDMPGYVDVLWDGQAVRESVYYGDLSEVRDK